jgi:DNA-binding Xre family transcriptional regulator
MLGLEINEMAHQKGVLRTPVFLRQIGFTVRESRTLTQKVGILLIKETTIQRLCEAFVCTPNNLFRWYGNGDHHLSQLNISATINPIAFLHNMNQQDVEHLLERAEQAFTKAQLSTVQGQGRIRLNVNRLVAQRLVQKPQVYLRSKGFTETETRNLLAADRISVKVKMLERLCIVFQCLPNDLFDWEGSEEHYLNALRKRPAPDLKTLLSKLPPEKVQELLRQLS